MQPASLRFIIPTAAPTDRSVVRAQDFSEKALRGLHPPASHRAAWNHACETERIVREEFGCDSPRASALALLHDILKDGRVSLSAVERKFGRWMADQVVALTPLAFGPMRERRTIFYRVLASASEEAHLVKLAEWMDEIRAGDRSAFTGGHRHSAMCFLKKLEKFGSEKVRAAVALLLGELNRSRQPSEEAWWLHARVA